MVSIPPSGLAPFRHDCTSRDKPNHPSFNPSLGLTAIQTPARARARPQWRCFNPSLGLSAIQTLYFFQATRAKSDVSIPHSGLAPFRPELAHFPTTFDLLF